MPGLRTGPSEADLQKTPSRKPQMNRMNADGIYESVSIRVNLWFIAASGIGRRVAAAGASRGRVARGPQVFGDRLRADPEIVDEAVAAQNADGDGRAVRPL